MNISSSYFGRSMILTSETVLFRIRWILLLLALAAAWVDNAFSPTLPGTLWAWFIIAMVVNAALGAASLIKPLGKYLSVAALIADGILYALPFHLIDSPLNMLGFFIIFPVLVAALRFSPAIGFGVAILESLSLSLHAFVGWYLRAPSDLLLTTIAIVLSFVVAAVVGFLAQSEKETNIQHTNQELGDLRRAMEGARLLIHTTDSLNLTTSYKAVLEGMLDAGVKGLPTARSTDGLAAGFVLLFDDKEDRRLHVAASRNLDKHDMLCDIPGEAGIVAETLRGGKAVVFDHVQQDPELSKFTAIMRCRSGVCYPLQAGLDQYGVVVLATPAPRHPSEQHLELMRAFTNQAGVAFQNAKLFQATRMEQDRMIQDENELRQKLARDLHDGPTQKVAALVMQMDFVARLLDENPAEAKKEVAKARDIAQQTVKEIRTALFTLRPLALETKGLSAALTQYAERMREVEKIKIDVEPGEFGTELDLNIASTVFSIIDEAVGNARKHAARSAINVRVYQQENSLVATVQDQGPGFDLVRVLGSYDKRASLGLQNMRDRAALVNGDLRIESQPGRGTRIMLIVPIIPKENAGPPP